MTAADSLDAILRDLPVLHPGEVWLAGAGPGDPGHLTLLAVAGLRQAEVVVHDALVDPRILAIARPQADKIFAGKRGGKPSPAQADISARLVALALDGRRVLRLKGGDPFMFGRGGEEMLALAEHGVPFRVIPGVTAGIAGLTAALIPATMRGVNQAILFATGHEADGPAAAASHDGALDWAAVARLRQPIVLFMAFTRLAGIVRALREGGLPDLTPAACIAAATTPAERILVSTLGELVADVAAAGLAAPVITVIGEIVAMRARLMALLPRVRAALP
jgi:uroporphyrin-III C-methyltransferase